MLTRKRIAELGSEVEEGLGGRISDDDLFDLLAMADPAEREKDRERCRRKAEAERRFKQTLPFARER